MFRIRLDRRLAVDSTLFGVLLTLFVAAADLFGLLSPLELWLYDQRALRCQRWTPRPTDKLVHVDIDDAALESMGRWPWHRSVIADVLDEICQARPKAVGLDVLFPEREEPQLQELPNKKVVTVDHDANLAAALKRLGSGVVAGSFPFEQERVSPVFADVRSAFVKNPAMAEPDVVQALREGGVTAKKLEELVGADFYRAQADAVFARIDEADANLTQPDLVAKVLPNADPSLDSPILRTFERQYANVQAARRLRRLALPLPTPAPPLFPGKLRYAPVAPVGEAAVGAGFVDYPRSADGKVRAVPLLIQSGGVMYPQLGLALACRMLGSDPRQIRLSEGAVIVPRPGRGDLMVPVRTLRANDLLRVGRDVPMAANVSWFGTGEWERMYDSGNHEEIKQHLPIGFVWDACLARERIVKNIRAADLVMIDVMPDDLIEKFTTAPPLAPDDAEGFNRRIAEVLARVDQKSIDNLPSDQRKQSMESLAKLRHVFDQNKDFAAQLHERRKRLQSELGGRAVLIGWTATASIADFIPTSLHASCPGVVMHGVIFNQIVNGEVWRTLPAWVTLLATVFVGLLVTAAVSLLTPAKALVSAALLAAAFLLVNGFLLFDRFNLILGAAGPLVAIGAVWSGGTLAKLVLERWERARITRRFRSYVDPKVVSFVEKHPEMVRFEGQVRECTVVFTDVAGFTQLTEKYGAETVVMLNELWGVMIPVIRQNGGTFNKFLGDGVMFFFNAPELNPRHAHDAVATVLEMGKALARFNAELATPRGWPAIRLRWGVSTGNMVVGDAGSAGTEEPAADYTVLGDHVNLGSRLESASKAVGTTVLMTARTVELSGNGFLMRPVGKLCVVGKQSSVMTYEVLARLDEATDAQKALAADTRAMVESFLDGRLKECMEAVVRLESAHGRGKLTDLYRERCEYFMQEPSPAPFDCQIVLTEK